MTWYDFTVTHVGGGFVLSVQPGLYDVLACAEAFGDYWKQETGQEFWEYTHYRATGKQLKVALASVASTILSESSAADGTRQKVPLGEALDRLEPESVYEVSWGDV